MAAQQPQTVKPRNVVFDVGGVLLDWNPRYLYRKLFTEEAAMEHFLTHVCSYTWNLMQDAGRPFADGLVELKSRYPEHAGMINAYHQRWEEMVAGEIAGSVAILSALRKRKVPLFAITNFSTEKFVQVERRYDFFRAFSGIVVSGEVRLIKPDPAIYLRLLHENRLKAGECVFIDDSLINVRGAEAVGMHAIHFRSPAQLRDDLAQLELL
ncbi:MAG: HAD family phosphatase [Gammaproteobacteria bacterium]